MIRIQHHLLLKHRHLFLMVCEQICKISRGTQVLERVGNKVMCTGMSFRGVLRNVDTGTQNVPSMTRVMVVYDKRSDQQDLGSSYATLSALLDQDPGTAKYVTSQSLRNEDYRNRFSIIYDKVINLGAFDSGASGDFASSNRYLHFNKKFKKPQVYVNTASPTGDVSNMAQGAFYLIIETSRVHGTPIINEKGPSYDFNFRLYYQDA